MTQQTAAEVAASMEADPRWGFATSHVKAVGHASTRAAQASIEGRHDDARRWASVGLTLCADAGVEPGSTLTDLKVAYSL